MVSAMGTRWKPLSTAAKTSTADGSAAAGVPGLWETAASVPLDGPQPAVSRLRKTAIRPTKMLPRGAPRWILLNRGKVMGVVGLRLGNTVSAGNAKTSGLNAGRGAAGSVLRPQGDSGGWVERRWAFPMQAFDGSVSGCPLSFHRWVAC